jgi:myosin heavy subunit
MYAASPHSFEILALNSLEQFLINYANERLQAIFIDRILKHQQEEYREEGFNWISVEFTTNAHTCQLLESKKGGMLSLLDEQCAYDNLTVGSRELEVRG